MDKSPEYQSGINKGHYYYDQIWPGFVHGIIHEMDYENWYEMAFPDGFHCITNTNPIETELQYNENIVNHVYLQPEISLQEGDTVIDAGANIGIFDLYLLQHYKDITLYSIEPMPDTFDVLEKNLTPYQSHNLKLFNKALGDRTETIESMIFYPNLTGNSTFHPETKMLQQKELRKIISDDEFEFFYKQTHIEVPVTTLSDIIAHEGIERIDLLKIDTEGSELDIFEGITGEDWSKIRQIAMEVHGVKETLEKNISILESHGFHVHPHRETLDTMDTMLITATRD